MPGDFWMPLGLVVVGGLLAAAVMQYRRYRARPTVKGIDGESISAGSLFV
jgi:hypothetical protein